MIKTEAYSDSLHFLGLTKKNGVGVGTLYSMKPTDGTGDFVWGRALSSYRLNSLGVLELVPSGTPRIDYTNTCPELLIEGARTNLLLRSQEFNDSGWVKAFTTVTANVTDAPDNTTTADLVLNTTANNIHIIYRQYVTSVNTTYTYSIYVKDNSINFIRVGMSNGSNESYIDVNLTNNSTANLTNGASWSNSNFSIKNNNNGYKRLMFTSTKISGSSVIPFIYLCSSMGVISYTGTGTKGVYLWGGQLEVSSNASSYIPTTSVSVTRPADIGYNSLLAYGLKGTIFIRARIKSSTYTKVDTLFSLSDGSLDDYITCSTNASRSIFITTMSGAIDTNSYNYSLASDGIYSIAIGYDFTGVNNNLNIAINGVLKRANSAQVNNAPTSLTRFDLGSLIGTLVQVDNRIIGQMYFADQLSDTDLTALTVQ